MGRVLAGDDTSFRAPPRALDLARGALSADVNAEKLLEVLGRSGWGEISHSGGGDIAALADRAVLSLLVAAPEE